MTIPPQYCPSAKFHVSRPNKIRALLDGKILNIKYKRVKTDSCGSQFLALATLIQNSKRLGHSAVLGKKKKIKNKKTNKQLKTK